jgi:hypothetical protein
MSYDSATRNTIRTCIWTPNNFAGCSLRTILGGTAPILGDAKRLRPEHLKADAPVLDGALRAIEKFNGRQGLDILVQAGLDNPDSLVQKKALLLFQSITGQDWYDDSRDQKLRRLLDKDLDLSRPIAEAKKWWRQHGAEFVARRRAKA